MNSSPSKAGSRPARRATAKDIEKLHQNRDASIFNPAIAKGRQARREARTVTKYDTPFSSHRHREEDAGEADQDYDVMEMDEEYEEQDAPIEGLSSKWHTINELEKSFLVQTHDQEILDGIFSSSQRLGESDEDMDCPDTSDAESFRTDRGVQGDSSDEEEDPLHLRSISRSPSEDAASENEDDFDPSSQSLEQGEINSTVDTEEDPDDIFISSILGGGDPAAYCEDPDTNYPPSFYRKSIISSTPSTPGASTSDLPSEWALEALHAAIRFNLI